MNNDLSNYPKSNSGAHQHMPDVVIGSLERAEPDAGP